MRKSANSEKIEREQEDLEALLRDLPDNPIPWASVLRIAAPLIARLAVRMALKRLKRDMSEEKVNTIGRTVGGVIREIVGVPPAGGATS